VKIEWEMEVEGCKSGPEVNKHVVCNKSLCGGGPKSEVSMCTVHCFKVNER
jgi:hypothetical protein